MQKHVKIKRTLYALSVIVFIGVAAWRISYSSQVDVPVVQSGSADDSGLRPAPAATNRSSVGPETNDSTIAATDTYSTPSHTVDNTVVLEPSVDEGVFGPYSVTNSTYSRPIGDQDIQTYKPLLTPNDPHAGQWWQGQLKLEQAWDETTGDASTTLAIIDTGFALDHEEFAGRWHTNTGEQGAATNQNPSRLNCTERSLPVSASCNLIDDDLDGIVDNESGAATLENPSQLNCADQSLPPTKDCNLIDDDSNGLVDDWRGWDFISHDASVQAGELNPAGPGVTHGSLVAGVAAASGNNAKGIAGVNWQTKILPIQAINDDGYGNSLSVGRSILYAVDQGADVINLSLGGASPDAYTRVAIAEAVSRGVVVVAAAGNGGCDCIAYPANYPDVVAVGAIDSAGNRASFSSYGAGLDVVAPGVGIVSASWHEANQTAAYAGTAGTSLAAPLVSGLAALVKAEMPLASPTQIAALLSESTQQLAIPASANRIDSIGFGAIDAHAAIARSRNPYSPDHIVSYGPIYHGAYFTPSSPLEQSAKVTVYDCAVGQKPTTPIYRAHLGNGVFYTASHREVATAQSAGYAAEVFTYMCALQNHDMPERIRTINVYAEFENRYLKN